MNAIETTGTTTSAVSSHIAIIDGKPTTTTHDIAEVYGKRHDRVLAVVRQRMTEAGEWGIHNFVDTPYTNQQNGQTYPVIRMTKKGFHFVVGKFTGAKAVQHQIAFADEFERMEAALTAQLSSNPLQLPSDKITPAQAQHLRELVQLVVESGKQTHGETWARFQRKFKVNSYLNLSPTQFDEAVAYLQGKMDGQSMAALVQKHFPDATKMVAAPAQAELNLQPVIDMERIRQTMAAANEVAAKVQSVVFFELLNGKKNWQNERWCLSFSADGRNDTAPPTPRAWQIESDAVIAPLLKLASDLGKEGGMLLATTSELLALASATTQSLSRRLAA